MDIAMTKEKALSLLEELLELEEKNDIGCLTRRERAEFQSIIKEAFEEKETEEISVDTPEGKMTARISSDPDNPGLFIDLAPTDTDIIIDLTLVKYDADRQEINIYNWDDAMREDYTSSSTLTGLDDLRESEKEYE